MRRPGRQAQHHHYLRITSGFSEIGKKEPRSYPLLLGVRGEKLKDVAAVVNVIAIPGGILRHDQGISDIEINPLVVYE